MAETVAHMVGLKGLKRLWDVAFCKDITKFSKFAIEQKKKEKVDRMCEDVPICQNLRVRQKGGSAYM